MATMVTTGMTKLHGPLASEVIGALHEKTHLTLPLINSRILYFLIYESSSSRFAAIWSATLGSQPKSLIMRMTFMAA